jgi:hypothetical protein
MKQKNETKFTTLNKKEMKEIFGGGARVVYYCVESNSFKVKTV